MNVLTLVSAILLSMVIIIYVILDGFDLGIGILFSWIKSPEERNLMMNSVAPVWDGNETWLVFGAAVLYGSFPLAYGILLPILYMPLTIMLTALIFRGVAFEFRFKAIRSRRLWDIGFSVGSMVAAFCQGLVLGTFVMGYASTASLQNPHQAHLITPFSIMTGVAVVVGYGLLGTTWLIRKTEGDLQEKMYKTAKFLLGVVLFFMIVVSIWTPLQSLEIQRRWFTLPNLFYFSPLPTLTAITFMLCFYCLKKRYEKIPFYLSILLFVWGYMGFCLSDWPYIVPHSIRLWEAAAPPSTQRFLLTGAGILLPILLAYTLHAYKIFSGKVTSGEGYH